MTKLIPIWTPNLAPDPTADDRAPTRPGKTANAPIQYRDGQQVKNPQAYAQVGQEIQEIPHAGLGRSARHFSNGYRSTQVFTESSPNSIFFSDSRVRTLMFQVRDKPSPTASSGP